MTKGWKSESARHSLAKKGIKTGRKKVKGRPIVERFRIYKFNELPKSVREKILEKNRNINVDYGEWHEFVLEDAKGDLAKYGYEDADISYSGFWSQGDGASFKATVDVSKWLKATGELKKYKELYKADQKGDVEIAIERHSSHYEHEMTMSAYTNYIGTNKKVDKQLDKIQDEILEHAREKARGIYRKLQENYEDLTSDKAVIETIKLNEYEFRKDGSIY